MKTAALHGSGNDQRSRRRPLQPFTVAVCALILLGAGAQVPVSPAFAMPLPMIATCTSTVGPGIPSPSTVPSGIDGFHAAWFGQSGYPTLCPGQRASAVVAYYNSGTKGWVQGKMGEVAYLGTWDPEPGQDRPSALGGDGTVGSPATGWPRYNRVASQPASWVGPNQVAWFQFQVIAPTIPGTYRLSIRPLIEGAQWMEDYGVFWYVTVAGTAPAGSVAPLPARWPSRALEMGMTDEPGGATQLRSSTPLRLRYTYLAGGVNTGQGWATWNPGGAFVTSYIQESTASGFIPVFSYYMLRQSSPGNGMGELAGDTANLANTSTMSAFFADLKLFFQRAGAFSIPVVLHVEPDLWGYVQQGFGDDATTAPARVRSTGMPELAGLPESVAGVARGIAKLRDAYAPNVLLGYHLSVWGTRVDPLYSKPSDAEIDALAARSASFYRSLGAAFDISFAEFSDQDAAFKRAQNGDDAAWWEPDDFARNVRYVGKYSTAAQQRIVMWQIPLGNTKMRAENNTWDHYQDNKVEWLLDEAGRANLGAYARAGVIGFLFGRGGDGSTCACDAAGDGVTNPAPIGANTRSSLNADDDGGYFRERAAAYYVSGTLALP